MFSNKSEILDTNPKSPKYTIFTQSCMGPKKKKEVFEIEIFLSSKHSQTGNREGIRWLAGQYHC